MAMASKPPDQTTNQTFYITMHALDRMRTRSEAAAHLSDPALIRILDDAIVAAIEDPENVKDVTDSVGDLAQLIFINGESLNMLVADGKVYALLKDNERKESKYKKAVITVLSEDMVKKHYTFSGNGKDLNSSLADQLKEVDVEISQPLGPDSRARQVGNLDPKSPPPQEVKHLGWVVLSPNLQEEVEEVTKEEACLRAQMDPWVRIYKYVPFRIQVELED